MNNVITDSESIYDIKNKIDAMMFSMKKEKYDIVLTLINNILNKDYKSLFKIKNIKKSNLDKIDVNKIIDKNNDYFIKYKIIIKKDDTVIDIIQKVLKLINYRFSKKSYNDIEYYNVVDMLV